MKIDVGDNIFFLALFSGATLLSHCSESKASEEKHSIYIGLGAHSEHYDCPEVCYGGDALFIAEYTYQVSKYTAAKALHISNPIIRERGFGTNAAFYGLNITW